jgi:hypothetical protein
VLACIDASTKAVENAEKGIVPKPKTFDAPKPVKEADTTALDAAPKNAKGVAVKCVKVKGKLRVKAIGTGFKENWFVQFPRNLRVENAEYQVDELRESKTGKFYRVFGNIYKK